MPAFEASHINQMGSPWDRFAEIAERLGVKPTDNKNTICIVSKGKSYDAYEVANAFLDRVDRIIKKEGPLPPFDEALADLLKKYEDIIPDDLAEILEETLQDYRDKHK